MGLKNMLEKTELKKILKPIIPGKNDFTTNFESGISTFSRDCLLLAPNNLTDKGNARLVGIAFDYMARFIIANKIEHNKKSVLEDMVCEKAFDGLGDCLNDKEMHYYQKCYTEAVMLVEEYIMNTTNNYDNLLPHVLLLSRLEQIKRVSFMVDAKYTLEHKGINDKEIEDDLKRNCEVFEQVFIESGIVKKDSVVVFNPHFGIWSIKCSGADADVFIDGVLYDFKCTSVYGYRSLDVAQICGYYLLHRLNQKSEITEDREFAPLRNMEFKAIALYKSRFGTIERYDVNQFDKEKFEEVMKQAEIFIEEYFEKHMKFKLFMESLRSKDKKI